jgi:hypothetical protein
MKINKNQLSVVVKSIIKEEIEKFQKKVLIESKKKKLMKELEMLNENDGSKRLSKVAMELNMSIDSVAKELTRLTGLEMEPNPNLKISPEFYELLTQKPNFEEIGEISIENGFVNFLPLGNYGKRMSLTSRADIVGLLNGEGGKKGDVEFESYYDNFGKHGIDGKKKFVQYITDALKSAGFKLRDIGDFEQAQELYKLFAPQKKRFEDNLWNEEFEMPKGVNESEKKKTTKKQITISELRQIIKENIESFDDKVISEHKSVIKEYDNYNYPPGADADPNAPWHEKDDRDSEYEYREGEYETYEEFDKNYKGPIEGEKIKILSKDGGVCVVTLGEIFKTLNIPKNIIEVLKANYMSYQESIETYRRYRETGKYPDGYVEKIDKYNETIEPIIIKYGNEYAEYEYEIEQNDYEPDFYNPYD